MRKVEKEFVSANILNVCVEHNGFHGGDEGHGSYVKIKFEDLASTSMLINGKRCIDFEIEFRGDTERETLLEGLEFIVKELKKHNGYNL